MRDLNMVASSSTKGRGAWSYGGAMLVGQGWLDPEQSVFLGNADWSTHCETGSHREPGNYDRDVPCRRRTVLDA